MKVTNNAAEDALNLLFGASSNANLQLADPALEQYYDDYLNRTIWILGEIGSEVLDIISKIVRWNREDKNIPVEERKPIKIFVFSPGGGLDVAYSVVSTIKLSKTPVWGYAIGMVASAASIIYLSCHRRFALPNAYFIFHRGSCSNIEGNYNEVQAAMNDYKEQIERLEQFYIENTEYPEEVVREKIQSDWYIHFDEGKQYGIITDLIDDISYLL
jgi:ATP-dependent Clp protease protease subunit